MIIPRLAVVVFSMLLAAPALAIPPGAKKDLPPPPQTGATPRGDALQSAVASPVRPAADRARDVYRHPYESLSFWGFAPGQTVIDLQPGGGYWTQILAPWALRTGGVYEAGLPDLKDPALPEAARQGRQAFDAEFSDQARYGRIVDVDFGPRSAPLATPGSIDVILTSREIHNWIGRGYLDKALADCFSALKPGGVLAVEEHRADPRAQAARASDGYVAVSTVVSAAERAGFRLDASSEINANPRDTKDHPFGVWTLPPSRYSTANGRSVDPGFDHAKYDAIGESDRMTLRFRKPG